MLSNLFVASFCIEGKTWTYVSWVKAVLEWPNRSLTTFAFSPAENRSVAQGVDRTGGCREVLRSREIIWKLVLSKSPDAQRQV